LGDRRASGSQKNLSHFSQRFSSGTGGRREPTWQSRLTWKIAVKMEVVVVVVVFGIN